MRPLLPKFRKIPKYAFSNCSALKEAGINEGVEYIETYAFQLCSELGTVNIPISVTSIGYRAFSACTNLHTFNYSSTKEQWNSIEKSDE